MVTDAGQALMGLLGLALIVGEREDQLVRWSNVHDDQHTQGELTEAAGLYLAAALASIADVDVSEFPDVPPGWPFEPEAWKPDYANPAAMLAKAGALAAAEIDRLGRIK